MPRVHKMRSVCAGAVGRSVTENWDEVTCRKCLRARPAPVVPFDDPLVEDWLKTVQPPTLAWARQLRTNADAVTVLLWLSDRIGALTYGLSHDPDREDDERYAMDDDIDSLAELIRARLAAGGDVG